MIKCGNTLAAVLIACTSLAMTGCAKKGCTDADATNYSSSAKKDDGTCRYEGTAIFWLSETSAQLMLIDGIQSLTVYVEDEIVGTITIAGQTYTAAPACEAANGVTVIKDLFSVKNRAFSYKVVDDQSVKRWAATFSMNGNACETVELIYYP